MGGKVRRAAIAAILEKMLKLPTIRLAEGAISLLLLKAT